MASASLRRPLLLFLLLILSIATTATPLKAVDTENPVLEITPVPLLGLSKDVVKCERVLVSGISRLKLGSLHGVHRLTLVPSVAIPERFHNKIQICFHRNSSLISCQCEKDDWKLLHKGVWNTFISPYEDAYVDVRYLADISDSVTITLDEEFQTWRLFALALGFVLLLLAPIVSSWVPFYYSSSMAIGILLVVIILLFQGMKLLPTGRKNAFYLTIYGSVLGAGSFVLHQLSMLVNSVLSSFGLGEEMHSSVSVFVLVGVILAGAGLGCWLVKKFVVSEDGNVDEAVAQFVKWAIRTIAVTCIFQSTIDTPLALALVSSCISISILVASVKWHDSSDISYFGKGSPWVRSNRQFKTKHQRAEFYSRSRKLGSQGALWGSPNSSSGFSNSPVKGIVSPSTLKARRDQQEYYSTFHNTPNRKKFSKKEWEEFTKDSTRHALGELSASPEFADWIVKNAERIQLLPDDSSDDSIGSGSGSSDETALESSSGAGLLKWNHR